MVSFTKWHYFDIGDTIRLFPKAEREKEFARWDRIFRADNPRYLADRFYDYAVRKKHVKGRRRC